MILNQVDRTCETPGRVHISLISVQFKQSIITYQYTFNPFYTTPCLSSLHESYCWCRALRHVPSRSTRKMVTASNAYRIDSRAVRPGRPDFSMPFNVRASDGRVFAGRTGAAAAAPWEDSSANRALATQMCNSFIKRWSVKSSKPPTPTTEESTGGTTGAVAGSGVGVSSSFSAKPSTEVVALSSTATD